MKIKVDIDCIDRVECNNHLASSQLVLFHGDATTQRYFLLISQY